MKTVLKRAAFVLGVMVVTLLLARGGVYALSGARLGKKYEVHPKSIPIPSDPASVAWGEHLARTRGCTDCQGPDYAGAVFIDDAVLARLAGSNLTPGEGGVGGSYTDQDWVRAIRHGVASNITPDRETGIGGWTEEDFFRALRDGIRPDGSTIDPESMPVRNTALMEDDEIRALWLYLRTVEPRAQGGR